MVKTLIVEALKPKNAQHSTLNAQCSTSNSGSLDVGSWMLDVL